MMGVYEYECPSGHVTEMFVPLAERAKTVLCGHEGCQHTASYVVSATPTTFRAADRKAFKRKGR
jgi:hypothetical protein